MPARALLSITRTSASDADNAEYQEAVRSEAVESVVAGAANALSKNSSGVIIRENRPETPVVEGEGKERERQRPALKHLASLVYLDACFRETLRLYSPIHIGRVCFKDDVAGGFAIPAGSGG